MRLYWIRGRGPDDPDGVHSFSFENPLLKERVRLVSAADGRTLDEEHYNFDTFDVVVSNTSQVRLHDFYVSPLREEEIRYVYIPITQPKGRVSAYPLLFDEWFFSEESVCFWLSSTERIEGRVVNKAEERQIVAVERHRIAGTPPSVVYQK